MSGHSKWSTIKHKKAKLDSARGKVFTKLIREIMVAARHGGGDIEGNAKLRLYVDKAKAANMPQENITRAIKKATGEFEGVVYEEIKYEGYGPFGTAAIVECLSDNKNRTVADIRHIFTKFGGNLGESNSVAWMFEHKGVIHAKGTKSEDELIDILLDYDVDSISFHDGLFTITCAFQELEFVKQGLEAAGMNVEEAKIEWVAKNPVAVSDPDQEEKVYKFLEALEENDDVREVYSNIE